MKKKRKENGYYTLEQSIEESKKYKTVGEFKRGCSRAYKIVCENKAMEQLTWLTREHEAQGYWDDNRILSETLKYQYISDFKKNAPGAYFASHRNGTYKNFTWLKRRNNKNKE